MPRGYPVLAADMDYMETASGWEFEYTDDVYPDARQLRVGWKPCCEVWVGRVEYLGYISSNGCAAGMSPGHGHLI